MAGGKSLRIGLAAGAIALAAIVYLLPKTPEPGIGKTAEKSAASEEPGFSIETYLASALKRLPKDTATLISRWEREADQQGNPVTGFDSVSRIWDMHGEPGLAGWFFERKATHTGTETDWLNAAYRYFDAYKNSTDSLQAAYFSKRSADGYSKVLELNPKNLDAKTDLAILYAESTEPMKGIMMLREVVAENPKHENAQLNLGFLSMKSGQYAKAVERFRTVLEINPGRIEMYLYSGEAYLRMGEKEKAAEQFTIFRNLSNDPEMNRQVDEYLKKLKSAS